jgi:DNA invertase Pin-like site-specific DNA recombinase
MRLGYARVSTAEQSLDSQIDALKEAGIESRLIYTDVISSRRQERPGLESALKALRAGDTLVVAKLDRLARSSRDLQNLAGRLQEIGADLVCLHQAAIDTTSPQGKLFFAMLGAFAEFERDIIATRTREGLAAAAKRGRKGGRPPKLNAQQLRQIRILLREDPDVTVEEVAAQYGVDSATLYRHLPGGRSALLDDERT